MLPTPVRVPQPPDQNNPVVQARIADIHDRQPESEIFSIGATVYHSQSLGTRSIVTYRHGSDGPLTTFWSSADFSLLQTISEFKEANGISHSLIMAWSVYEMDQLSDGSGEDGETYQPPAIPTFPEGPATFLITSENPTPEARAAIQSLHDVYNNEYTRLLAAKEAREQAYRDRAVLLKANPPKPQDIILSHWRIETPAKTEK